MRGRLRPGRLARGGWATRFLVAAATLLGIVWSTTLVTYPVFEISGEVARVVVSSPPAAGGVAQLHSGSAENNKGKGDGASEGRPVLAVTGDLPTQFQSVSGLRSLLGHCTQMLFSITGDQVKAGRLPSCHIPFVVVSLAFEARELSDILCEQAAIASQSGSGYVSIGKLIVIENGVNADLAAESLDLGAIASVNPTRLVVHRSPVFSGIAWAYNRGMEEILKSTPSGNVEAAFSLFMAPNANVSSGSGATATFITTSPFLHSCSEFASLIHEQMKHATSLSAATVDRCENGAGCSNCLNQEVVRTDVSEGKYILGVAPRRWKSHSDVATPFMNVRASSGPPAVFLGLPAMARTAMGILPWLEGDYRTFYLSLLSMKIVGSFDENFFMVSSAEAMRADWRLRSHMLGFTSAVLAGGRLAYKRRRVTYSRPGSLQGGFYWAHRWSYHYNEVGDVKEYLAVKWGGDLLPEGLDGWKGSKAHPYDVPSLSADMWILDRERLAAIRDLSEFQDAENATAPPYNLDWRPNSA